MNIAKLKSVIVDMCVDSEEIEEIYNDFEDGFYKNPTRLKRFIKSVDEDTGNKCTDILEIIAEHESLIVNVTKDEIKAVYIKLKDRDKNPRGEFDKQGRFYVEDNDLLDTRSPSVQYPFSQMNAARTAKFIKALAEKYKCQSLAELEAVAFSQ